MSIFIFKNNQQEGPYEIETIQQGLASGRFTSDDFAFQDGCEDWVPLHTLLPDEKAHQNLPTQALRLEIEENLHQIDNAQKKDSQLSKPSASEGNDQTPKIIKRSKNWLPYNIYFDAEFCDASSNTDKCRCR